MLKSCKYCGRIHDINFVCTQKPMRFNDDTEQRKLRNTSAYRKAKAIANDRDLHLCRLCLLNHELTSNDLETHHIIPLAEDMTRAVDEDNLITLCRNHHEAAERGDVSRAFLLDLIKHPPGVE